MFVFFYTEAQQEWRKKGDFKAVMSTYQHGGSVGAVKYAHPNNGVIKEIELYSEHPGELRMMLKIASNKYHEVEQYLTACGFPKRHGGLSSLDIYSIQFPNARYLADFLHALKHFANGLDDVSNEIIKNIAPYMYNEPTITGWVKEGSILNHPYESYISSSTNSKIKELSLAQNTVNGALHLSVQVKKYACDEIANKLESLGITSTDNYTKKHFSTLSYPVTSKNDLENTLQALAKADKTVAPMMESMIYSYTHMKPFSPKPPMDIIMEPFAARLPMDIRVTSFTSNDLDRLTALLDDLLSDQTPSSDNMFAFKR